MIPANGINNAGTHTFIAGTFEYKNVNAASGAGCNTDGEGIIFDSNAGGPPTPYKYQEVTEQNVMWANGSSGYLILPGGTATNDLAQYVAFKNTSYGNFQDPKNGGGGELRLNQYSPSGTGSYAITNNIFIATKTNTGSGQVWGAATDCLAQCTNTSIIQIGGNYIWQSAGTTSSNAGDPNTEVTWSNGVNDSTTFPYGTNTYNGAGLASPGSLPITEPNCAAYTNVEACMNDPVGYNVAGHVWPSGGAVGKGYAAPTGTCAADSYYPNMAI